MKRSISQAVNIGRSFEMSCFKHSPTMPELLTHAKVNTISNPEQDHTTNIDADKNHSMVNCKRFRSAVSQDFLRSVRDRISLTIINTEKRLYS